MNWVTAKQEADLKAMEVSLQEYIETKQQRIEQRYLDGKEQKKVRKAYIDQKERIRSSYKRPVIDRQKTKLRKKHEQKLAKRALRDAQTGGEYAQSQKEQRGLYEKYILPLKTKYYGLEFEDDDSQ